MSTVTEESQQAVAYRARWVFPVDGPPLDGGVVTIAGGRIVAVGKNESGKTVHDLGNVALLPGLVNAHTHLEFSGLAQPLGGPGMEFAQWIGEVVRWRKEEREKGREGEGEKAAVVRGLEESSRAGVVAVGEIASAAWPMDVTRAARDFKVTVFRELLGLAEARVEPLMEVAREHLAACGSAGVRGGLSPHAPYTVHPELLARACELSAAERVPVAMHVAESREELLLIQSHAGPLVELLISLGAWRQEVLRKGLRPIDYLHVLATADRALVIHGNYLSDDEVRYTAAHRDRLSLVYCPRTHAYFGHEPYPLAKMLMAGVRVAVGTDSRASNPDLRLFEELRHIARHHPKVKPAEILRMGTLAGAEALGLADELGSLAVGKGARLAVVKLEDGAKDGYESLFGWDEATCKPLALMDRVDGTE